MAYGGVRQWRVLRVTDGNWTARGFRRLSRASRLDGWLLSGNDYLKTAPFRSREDVRQLDKSPIDVTEILPRATTVGEQSLGRQCPSKLTAGP